MNIYLSPITQKEPLRRMERRITVTITNSIKSQAQNFLSFFITYQKYIFVPGQNISLQMKIYQGVNRVLILLQSSITTLLSNYITFYNNNHKPSSS